MSEYPEWRKRQCPYCAAGRSISAAGEHWNGSSNPPACQAMDPDKYIEQLESRLANLIAENKRLNDRLESIGDALDDAVDEWQGDYPDAIRKLADERDEARQAHEDAYAELWAERNGWQARAEIAESKLKEALKASAKRLVVWKADRV